MRIAYVAHLAEKNYGVRRKISHQAQAWERLGHTVLPCLIVRGADREPGVYPGWRRYDLLNPHRELLADLVRFAPDMVYLRDTPASPFLAGLFFRFPDSVIIEINSNNLTELRLLAERSFHDRRGYWLACATGWYPLRGCQGITCVTRELADAPEYARARNRLYSPNGLLLDEIPVLKREEMTEQTHVVFAGTPDQPWNGVDMLPRLACLLGPNVVLHVFGPQGLPDAPENLLCYGYQPQEVVRKAMARAHFGLGTMALSRKSMQEACPLKTREYLAHGLPVLLPYQDTAFLDATPEWVCPLPDGEGGLFEESVIRGLKDFLETRKYRVVRHEESRPYIDSMELEKKKLHAIQSWLR